MLRLVAFRYFFAKWSDDSKLLNSLETSIWKLLIITVIYYRTQKENETKERTTSKGVKLTKRPVMENTKTQFNKRTRHGRRDCREKGILVRNMHMQAIVLPDATADIVLPFLSFDIMFNGNNSGRKTPVKRVRLSGRRSMIIYARSFNSNSQRSLLAT